MKLLVCLLLAVFALSATALSQESPEGAVARKDAVKEKESAEATPRTGGEEVSLMGEFLGLLMSTARGTSYSSLLTLNLANVVLLGLFTIPVFFYFGGTIPFGRSLGGLLEVDMDGVMSAVSSLTPVVQEAVRVYHNLQQTH